MEAVATIDASTPELALALAQEQFKASPKLMLVEKSIDENAAFDWVAEATPI